MKPKHRRDLQRQITSTKKRLAESHKSSLAALDDLQGQLDEAFASQGTIQAWRASRKWTQRDLAAALGVSTMTVSHWENRTTKPSPAHLKALQALGYRQAVK